LPARPSSSAMRARSVLICLRSSSILTWSELFCSRRSLFCSKSSSILFSSDSTNPFWLSALSESILSGGIPSLNHDAITWHRGTQRMLRARGQRDSGVSNYPTVPKTLKAFAPYIYSREELRRLLDAIGANDHPRSSIDPDTYKTLLLLLYGAGLRISEALTLTMEDVNLAAGILRIRESKFYKTRLVPIGTDLLQILVQYAR